MISRDVLKKRFETFILLSFFVLVMEVVGGYFTGSLALVGDAGHVLVDLLALLLAYFAIQLSVRRADEKFTFGYHRAEILAAIVNGMVLFVVTSYIFYNAYSRFISPRAVKGPEMFVISLVGFLANAYVVMMLRDYEKENLNLRGAYLHVLSDMLSSVGVVVASVLVVVTGNYVFDSIISVVIGLLILKSALELLNESIYILMEAAPKELKIEDIMADMQKINGVKEIHDIHVWSISSDVYALSAHVLIRAKSVKSMNKIISRINRVLKTKHNISHTVLQSECESCIDERHH